MKMTQIARAFLQKDVLWVAGLGMVALAVAVPGSLRLMGAQAVPAHGLPSDIKGTPGVLIPVTERKIAADFSLVDAQGHTVTLSEYKGRVVLLDFWATWCGGCKVEIPWYVAFDKQYRGKGLAVVGVAMDEEGMKVVRPFLEQRHIDYPVVIGNEAFMQRYSRESLPLTLLIDRNGKIAEAHSGIVDKGSFESHIQELLR